MDTKYITTLKKAQTHISKIIDMEEQGEYCIDIIQQLNAVMGYLNSARNQKLKNHLNSCFAKGMSTESPVKKKKLIDELLLALKMTK